MENQYKRVRGMDDILPNVSPLWHMIEGTARDIFARYNYHEIRTPMVEKTQVFTRTSGSSSDIVSKQMYNFKDKGNRDISLRPEGTAGIVRAFVEHKLYGPEYLAPLKFYYMGPMFRYERPGATHNREFYQIGCEALNAISPQVDAETMSLALDIFKGLDISEIKLEINTLGDKKSRENYREVLIKYFSQFKDELSLDSQRRLQSNPLRILDSKSKKDKKFIADAPKIQDSLSSASRIYFQDVLAALDNLNIKYVVQQRLVRGLDYYSDTVFEIMAKNTALNDKNEYVTICAGGRYNSMINQFGGPKDTGGIGFAFGEERLTSLLFHQLKSNTIDYFICTDILNKNEVLTNKILDKALKMANKLRINGNSVEINFQKKSIKSQKKIAYKLHSKNILICEI